MSIVRKLIKHSIVCEKTIKTDLPWVKCSECGHISGIHTAEGCKYWFMQNDKQIICGCNHLLFIELKNL